MRGLGLLHAYALPFLEKLFSVFFNKQNETTDKRAGLSPRLHVKHNNHFQKMFGKCSAFYFACDHVQTFAAKVWHSEKLHKSLERTHPALK